MTVDVGNMNVDEFEDTGIEKRDSSLFKWGYASEEGGYKTEEESDSISKRGRNYAKTETNFFD